MSITVRLATPAELDEVRYVGFATWPPTYGPIAGPRYVVHGLDTYWDADTLEDTIRAGNLYVAVDDDETEDGAANNSATKSDATNNRTNGHNVDHRTTIIGVSEVDHFRDDLVLWKLYVLPDHQRSGVGHALLDAVKHRAAAEGKALLTEYVAANSKAGNFYRSQGFVDMSVPKDELDSVWLRYGS